MCVETAPKQRHNVYLITFRGILRINYCVFLVTKLTFWGLKAVIYAVVSH